jgi:hypothetical protein
MIPLVTLGRRGALKFFAGGALALVPAAVRSEPAAAGRTWCRLDPVVKIDGKTADIWLSSYQELNQAATGPTKIVISMPTGIQGSVLATDRGFGGLGYDIRFETTSTLSSSGSIKVKIAVYTPSSNSTLPLKVEFTPRSSGLASGSASGYVNQTIIVRTK